MLSLEGAQPIPRGVGVLPLGDAHPLMLEPCHSLQQPLQQGSIPWGGMEWEGDRREGGEWGGSRREEMREETLPPLPSGRTAHGRLCWLLHVSNVPLQAEAWSFMSEANTVEEKEVLPMFV